MLHASSPLHLPHSIDLRSGSARRGIESEMGSLVDVQGTYSKKYFLPETVRIRSDASQSIMRQVEPANSPRTRCLQDTWQIHFTTRRPTPSCDRIILLQVKFLMICDLRKVQSSMIGSVLLSIFVLFSNDLFCGRFELAVDV